jgi:lysozyme family protein
MTIRAIEFGAFPDAARKAQGPRLNTQQLGDAPNFHAMSEQSFQKAIAFILSHENEYLRGHWGDPNYVVAERVAGDPGGTTKYGIDQASHPGVDVANLTQDQAVAIYRQEWNAHNLDALPDKLAIAAFDVWVNGGHADLWLQCAYNDTMPEGFHLIEDGVLGPVSVKALNACTPGQIDAIAGQFIAERDVRFENLAANPSMAKFLAGWEQRDADLKAYLAGV